MVIEFKKIKVGEIFGKWGDEFKKIDSSSCESLNRPGEVWPMLDDTLVYNEIE